MNMMIKNSKDNLLMRFNKFYKEIIQYMIKIAFINIFYLQINKNTI